MSSSFSHLRHQQDRVDNPSTILARQPTQQEPLPSKTKAVLYVWGPHEKNSENALNIARETKAIDYLSIVDVRNLRFSDIPDWLTGVPTVLTTKESGEDATVFKGTSALEKIQDISSYPDEFDPVTTEDDGNIPDSQQPRGDMPIQQNIQGIGTMPTRQRIMPRGIGDDQPPANDQSTAPPAQLDFSQTETKVSAQDMQVQIEEILKRREEMMNEAQKGGAGPPLPTAMSSS